MTAGLLSLDCPRQVRYLCGQDIGRVDVVRDDLIRQGLNAPQLLTPHSKTLDQVLSCDSNLFPEIDRRSIQGQRLKRIEKIGDCRQHAGIGSVVEQYFNVSKRPVQNIIARIVGKFLLEPRLEQAISHRFDVDGFDASTRIKSISLT